MIFFVIILANINSVEQNLPFRGVIETAHELNHCGFARTVHADNSQTFADFEFEIDMTKRPEISVRIFERNIPEFHLVFSVVPLFYGERSLNHVGGGLDKIKIDFGDLIIDAKCLKCADQ